MEMQKPEGSIEIHVATVRGLHALLGQMLARYGDTPVCTSDMEAGLTAINALTLWDTQQEMKEGVCSHPLTLVLHSGPYPKDATNCLNLLD